jgi:predicted RecA/RadA family phage recombinase
MAKNFIQPGQTVGFTNGGSAVVSGQVIVKGALVGVSQTDVAASGLGVMAIEGVYAIPKKAEALTQGTKVYWDAAGNPVVGSAGSGAATATVSSYTYAGVAVADALSGDATVQVKLNV